MFRPPTGFRLAGAIVLLVLAGCAPPSAPPARVADGDSFLFCFWNVENFFDNEVNGLNNHADKGYDTWFGRDRAAFQQKLENLVRPLIALNDGRGPDLLGLAEVENEHAAELLRAALNARLSDPALHYQPPVMKNPHGGRNIATALLSRLPIDRDRTQLLGRRLRILETHVEVNGHDLVVVVSHWTSRVSDKNGEGRAKYADQIYGRYRAISTRNPTVDFLVCGDFNDNPDEPSVTEHLHASGDLAKVKAGGKPPLLYDLFAPAWERPENKTYSHTYRGHFFQFDQIAVSPGLLDAQGWSCATDTARVVTDKLIDRKGRPIPFGNERDRTPLARRGASDHLPVTVRLQVEGER